MAVRAELQCCAANADVGGRHDSEEYIQPEKKARVDAENLGRAKPVGS